MIKMLCPLLTPKFLPHCSNQTDISLNYEKTFEEFVRAAAKIS